MNEIMRIRLYADTLQSGYGEYQDDIIVGFRKCCLVGILEETLNEIYHQTIYVSEDEVNRFRRMAEKLDRNELKED